MKRPEIFKGIEAGWPEKPILPELDQQPIRIMVAVQVWLQQVLY